MTRADLIDRIVEEEPGKPSVRDTRISVLAILRQISEGLPEDEILRQAPGLKKEDLLACAAYAAEFAPGSRAPELAKRLAERFPVEGREDRIGRALSALSKLRGSLKLDRETLKWIAQDPDLEDL